MAAVLLLVAADASAQPRALRERQQQTESSGETEKESLTGAKPTVEAVLTAAGVAVGMCRQDRREGCSGPARRH